MPTRLHTKGRTPTLVRAAANRQGSGEDAGVFAILEAPPKTLMAANL